MRGLKSQTMDEEGMRSYLEQKKKRYQEMLADRDRVYPVRKRAAAAAEEAVFDERPQPSTKPSTAAEVPRISKDSISKLLLGPKHVKHQN